MSAAEQDVLNALLQLDAAARRRVVQAAASTLPDDAPPSVDWLDIKRAIRAEMRAKYGALHISAADVLNAAREERLNDLTDRD
jgi:hypothetical protein